MNSPLPRCAVVGRGRLGTTLAAALRATGTPLDGPLGRGAACGDAGVVLLCVPDGEIAAAAGVIAPGPLVGHCSGASTLAPLAPHRAFSLHPLMTVTAGGTNLIDVRCAVAGDPIAHTLARALGMVPFEVAEHDRAAYHAAASIASNFLVTLEWCAERLAASAGTPRAALVPLARAALANWERDGAPGALTGPIARGDELTVARQRAAVAERTPDLLAVFDALAAATRTLAQTAVAQRSVATHAITTGAPA